MNQSIVKTSLIPRTCILPKGLIYNEPKTNFYRLINTKTGKAVGEMLAFPEENSNRKIYDIAGEKKVFRIYSLEIDFSERRKGWGEYFMNFAKQESYKRGCEGRLFLVAYNPFNSPHIFYKKQGLIAKDKRIEKMLDSFFKKDSFFTNYPACEMYLPLDVSAKEQKSIEKNSFWVRVKKFLGIK